MAQLLDYKCPHCDAKIEFDAGTQRMKCPFCDSEFDVASLLQKDEVLKTQQPDDFNWSKDESEFSADEDAGMSVFTCNSCGGEIIGDETTAATSCPFCGNPVVMSGRLSGYLKPDFVIPFKLDKKAAKQKLKDYVSTKRFAPSSFKSENKLEEIKGLYVPFWLFDSDISAGIQYKATKVRTWSDRKYEYTETSYFDVYRAGDMSFANIPVDGSSKMPDELMESIEPFDFSQAVDFQTAYLAGYLADKYDVSMEQSTERANQRVKTSAEDTLKGTVTGYSTVTPESSSIQLKNGVAKYALYPVWLLNTTYKGEKYTFAMNGQSGKFVGNLPVDKGKLFALFAGCTVGLTPILFLLGRLFGLF